MSTTNGFGASSSGTAAVWAETLEEDEEDIDKYGKNDPNKLLQCPYDKNHQIRSFRFPCHLIKCRKNHPKLARELKTCPFNARHLVHKHELSHHTETCEDRTSVNIGDLTIANGTSNWTVPLSTWENPNMTEDWDKEADDDAPAFVWGKHTILQNLPETRPVNNLDPSARAPKNLPWL